MKNYSERIGDLYANFQKILEDLSTDSLELVSKRSSYRGISEVEGPKLQKATTALVDLVSACGEGAGIRVSTLYMMAKADYTVFPLSHLTVSASRELELLFQTMVDVERRLEGQVE